MRNGNRKREQLWRRKVVRQYCPDDNDGEASTQALLLQLLVTRCNN